jgi:hypothetical protein
MLGACALPALVAASAAAAPRLHGQSAGGLPILLAANLTFDGQHANAVQPDDSAVVGVATAQLRRALRDAGVVTLADSARAAGEAERLDRPGIHCNASADCMRDVGRRLGAAWVVTGRISKISNLIWYLSADLVDVATGEVRLAESFELKGARDDIVPRGAASLGRRVARAVARGTAVR